MSIVQDHQNVFILDIEYIVPIETVEPLIAPHMDFIAEQYAKGHFIVSGPKVPRSGGVILARSSSRAALEEIIALDPFTIHNVATYKVTEFIPRTAIEGFKQTT